MAERMRAPLGKKSRKVLAFVIRYKQQCDGVGPSIREMMAALDISTTSLAKWHLERLELAGKITLLRHEGGKMKEGGIAVIGGQWVAPEV